MQKIESSILSTVDLAPLDEAIRPVITAAGCLLLGDQEVHAVHGVISYRDGGIPR